MKRAIYTFVVFLMCASVALPQNFGVSYCSATLATPAGGTATPLLVPNIGATGNNALAAPSPVLAFGKQGTGTSSPALHISISNSSNAPYCAALGVGCGTGTLTVSSMVVSGPNAGDFVISGSCGTITSGSDCEPTITFTPTAAANTNETATLTVTDNGTTATQTMSLTGISSTVTSLATSAGPSALSGSTNYQVTTGITNNGSNFTIASTGIDLDLNGHAVTYGNASTASQVNAIAFTNYNTQITVHNGTLATGAGTNTNPYSGNLSSVIGPTAGYTLSPTLVSSFFNLTINYNIQYANAISDNGGLIVFHDNIVNNSAVGNCPSVGCRDDLQATPVYQENVTGVTSGATQIYNNTFNGGPQGGINVAAPGAVVSYNTINPGNAAGNNTNDFGVYAWRDNVQVHHNVIGNPQTSASNSRGIQISPGGGGGSATGVDVYDNLIYVIETPTNSEYGGCQTGGTYGLQFDDNPIGPNTAYSNYITAYAKACSGTALRITDSEYASNESHNNTLIGSRLSGATACTRSPDSPPKPGCANASEWDGPTGFTSLNDTYTGDSCDVLLDVIGGSGVVIQSPIFNEGANPSDFHTFCAENGTTSEGGGPVTNFWIVDATFNAGTSATDTDFPQYNVGNQGDVTTYIAWTQNMAVTKASGSPASGAVVTWTDALSNHYTCTTNSSGTCSVYVPQYRNNNDTAANQHENRNPYSLSIPLSGCTTYTASGMTISATGTQNITLSGC